MIRIAHRGNLDGPNPEKENHPDYITAALKENFSAEIDAWIVDNKIYLGHDGPEYEATEYFQYQGKWYAYNFPHFNGSWHGEVFHEAIPALWIHCKNFDALNDTWFLKGHKFFHDQDDFTLTDSGYIWTYPRNLPVDRISVAVMPERVPEWDISNAGAVCTDFPRKYL